MSENEHTPARCLTHTLSNPGPNLNSGKGTNSNSHLICNLNSAEGEECESVALVGGRISTCFRRKCSGRHTRTQTLTLTIKSHPYKTTDEWMWKKRRRPNHMQFEIIYQTNFICHIPLLKPLATTPSTHIYTFTSLNKHVHTLYCVHTHICRSGR